MNSPLSLPPHPSCDMSMLYNSECRVQTTLTSSHGNLEVLSKSHTGVYDVASLGEGPSIE